MTEAEFYKWLDVNAHTQLLEQTDIVKYDNGDYIKKWVILKSNSKKYVISETKSRGEISFKYKEL